MPSTRCSDGRAIQGGTGCLPAPLPPRLPTCLPTSPPPCPTRRAQFTLYHFFGYSYGASTHLLARLAGAAELSMVPLSQLVLKVSQLETMGLWAGWGQQPADCGCRTH